MATGRRWRRRAAGWPVVCAGRALTLALLLMLALLLAGVRQLLTAWLAGISVATLATYGYDKVAARSTRLRVPERVLLGLALVGGTAGAAVGMLLFHHKTRKRPFQVRFLLIVGLQFGVLLAWALSSARP